MSEDVHTPEIVYRTVPFDVEGMLNEGIECSVAASGPSIRPTWFQFEDGYFWIISGPHTRLYHRVLKEPKVSILVNASDNVSGRMQQIIATGNATVEDAPYNTERAERMLKRYMGDDISKWSTTPDNFPEYLKPGGPGGGCCWLRVKTKRLLCFDFSFGLVFDQPPG